jgi:hypothetical protein
MMDLRERFGKACKFKLVVNLPGMTGDEEAVDAESAFRFAVDIQAKLDWLRSGVRVLLASLPDMPPTEESPRAYGSIDLVPIASVRRLVAQLDSASPPQFYTSDEVAAMLAENETLRQRCGAEFPIYLGREEVSRRLKVNGIAVTDPMWTRLESCRERCAHAGKSDLLPMIFALEEIELRLPPRDEWVKYGTNPTAAFREARRVAKPPKKTRSGR